MCRSVGERSQSGQQPGLSPLLHLRRLQVRVGPFVTWLGRALAIFGWRHPGRGRTQFSDCFALHTLALIANLVGGGAKCVTSEHEMDYFRPTRARTFPRGGCSGRSFASNIFAVVSPLR
ncbi:hypothetical protein E2C01_054170 [Portunus trituberculatus]|uniref:Uncharacterized protein n=1 Tax=Portunus trituberculatus TaxID=210409 RepID=A0A5B7GR83_PORTR|nr:hypothetical protein [Portunus trituberculatus]